MSGSLWRASPHDPKERILKRELKDRAEVEGDASPHDPKERILKPGVAGPHQAPEDDASPHDPKERILKQSRLLGCRLYWYQPHPTIRKSGY